jgi:phosphoglycolate phosphatase
VLNTFSSEESGAAGERIDLVILDLDGTIYSSTATTVGAVECAVRDMNRRAGLALPVPTEDRILDGVGSTREEYVAKVIPELPPDRRAEMSDLIWHWEHELIDQGRGSLFPGAVDALDRLESDDRRLAIATNAGVGYMNFILDYFSLRNRFDECWCAGEHGTNRKSDLIGGILRALSIEASRSVMVGDRESDVAAALAAGAWAVGCTWGFADRQELAAAHRVIESFEELPGVVRDWFRQ